MTHGKDLGFIDLLGDKVQNYEKVQLTDILQTVEFLGAQYALLAAEEMKAKDATSSGDGADSIQPLAVTVNGDIYTVEIEAERYLSYVDAGVDGWANSRGSIYRFKTKGVDPNGAMVKSVKSWLSREGKMAQSKYAVMNRGGKQRSSITDFSTRQAMTTAYMIKRQGIKAKHFFRDATKRLEEIAMRELGIAVKVDIINNLAP